jgi:hypothetical protein
MYKRLLLHSYYDISTYLSPDDEGPRRRRLSALRIDKPPPEVSNPAIIA